MIRFRAVHRLRKLGADHPDPVGQEAEILFQELPQCGMDKAGLFQHLLRAQFGGKDRVPVGRIAVQRRLRRGEDALHLHVLAEEGRSLRQIGLHRIGRNHIVRFQQIRRKPVPKIHVRRR